MTIAALVAGFAVSLSMEASSDEIETYARWEIRTFLGPRADVCEKLAPWGIAFSQGCDADGCSHNYLSYANGWGEKSCDFITGQWSGPAPPAHKATAAL